MPTRGAIAVLSFAACLSTSRATPAEPPLTAPTARPSAPARAPHAVPLETAPCDPRGKVLHDESLAERYLASDSALQDPAQLLSADESRRFIDQWAKARIQGYRLRLVLLPRSWTACLPLLMQRAQEGKYITRKDVLVVATPDSVRGLSGSVRDYDFVRMIDLHRGAFARSYAAGLAQVTEQVLEMLQRMAARPASRQRFWFMTGAVVAVLLGALALGRWRRGRAAA